MDRHFVIAVATDRFTFEDVMLMGISTQAPLFQAIEGKTAGETCAYNGRSFSVDLVM